MFLEIGNESAGEFHIVFVVGKNFTHKFVSDAALLEKLGFDGSDESVCLLGEKGELYVGVEDGTDHESFRIAAAKAINTLKSLKIKTASVAIYDQLGTAITEAIALGLLLGAYEFTQYKSKPKPSSLEKILFTAANYHGAAIETGALKAALSKATLVADAVNFVRDLVNQTPEDLTPTSLASAAQQTANDLKLECNIYDESYLKSHEMGAFLAVSRASAKPPRLIHLTHKPANARKTVALVGKGLTYDSGGLSLKPADYMSTMKADMGGAATVIAAVKLAAELALPIELHAIIGATENMIGGNAYKPDDVLIAKNGKTIEVKNTDAEGRLVLADCLCFAQDKVPHLDYLVDLATLTGACVVALGEYTSGVMGFNGELKQAFLQAANVSGELAAELPFNRHLKKLIKSEVADIANAASTRYGGSITAGLFLSEFIEDKNREKWAHIDIAGPGYVEKAWGVNPFGASGYGVRLVSAWLESL
ncbi:cytosol aminopeptidase [Campylobacterota bacterium]|nr:cytosol aminopeptidase [Campylobacterota bacterium]